MPNHAQFVFNPADLTRPRKFGISAYMRIKNEQQFVRLAVESHLPFYDEIVAVYNDCSDDTEAILLELQAQYPEKIRVFHYLPKVYPPGSPQQAAAVGRDDDVHALANYYNWAMAQCTYSIACKLDADHLAIPHKLSPVVAKIRAEYAAGGDKVYPFSGLNVLRNAHGELGMSQTGQPFVGNWDHLYHRIDCRSFFVNHKYYEGFNLRYIKSAANEYVGLVCIHLNHLKRGREKSALANFGWMPYAEFATQAHINARIRDSLKFSRKLRFGVYRHRLFFNLRVRLTGREPSLPIARLRTLKAELDSIDFARDAVVPLAGLL